jgi:hypothetical protein
MTKAKERKRLDSMEQNPAEHERRSDAKTFKLPLTALKIFEHAGRVHGQQSRAIQIAVELLIRESKRVPDTALSAIKNSPLTSKTYRLPPRTVEIIQAMVIQYGTQGDVLAACAYLLAQPDPALKLLQMTQSKDASTSRKLPHKSA